jgi:serine/threonine protein kinase
VSFVLNLCSTKYCGTDGYMSPEILMGVDFSLPSDIFSLGIIFCEIISRHLVDANTFKRQMPTFGLDEEEVRSMATKGCPPDLIQLSIDCCKVDPLERPDMRQVVKRLRAIEQHVMQEEIRKGKVDNVGSLRGSSLQAIIGNKKKNPRPIVMRLPSFEGQIKVQSAIKEEEAIERSGSESSSSDDDMEEALKALENVNIGMGMPGVPPRGSSKMALDSIRRASSYKVSGHGNPWWDEDSDGSIALPSSWIHHVSDKNANMSLDDASTTSGEEEYSTSVIRPSKINASRTNLAAAMEEVTAMETDEEVHGSNITVRHRAPLSSIDNEVGIQRSQLNSHNRAEELSEAVTLKPSEHIKHTRSDSGENITQSFMTARSSHQDHHYITHGHHDPSLAMATLASSIYEPALLYHRFTLVKNGMKRPTSIQQTIEDNTSSSWGGSLIPAQLILANALTKCNVCNKRLGFGAYMDCDDCPYKTHVGCAAMAEPTCQEMQIPHSGGNTPMLSPVNATRRGSVSSGSPPGAASIALAKAVQTQSASPTIPTKKEKDTKSPPSSVSRGVNLFRRRNSKSPPPKVSASVKA